MFEMCGKDKKKWDILFLYRKKERKIDNEISLLHPFLVNQIYRVNVRDSPNFCPSKVRRLLFTKNLHFATVPVLSCAYISCITFSYRKTYISKRFT